MEDFSDTNKTLPSDACIVLTGRIGEEYMEGDTESGRKLRY